MEEREREGEEGREGREGKKRDIKLGLAVGSDGCKYRGETRLKISNGDKAQPLV